MCFRVRFVSKVSDLLSDPEAAQKIQSIASSLSAPEASPDAEVPSEPAHVSDDGDVSGLLSAFSGGGASLHRRETELLRAVQPYLRPSRAGKIDRALKAIRVIDLLSNLR